MTEPIHIPRPNIDLDTIVLTRGHHVAPGEDGCLLEMVSWAAGETWTDDPECVSPVLATFGQVWNDSLPDAERQQLKVYIAPLIDTAGDPRADERRAWMATDWLVRVHTPAWLRLAGLVEHAATLEALPELIDGSRVPPVRLALQAARRGTTAAWDAAEDTAGDASWTTARNAVWAAAGAAARTAAGDAAGAATRDAATVAAWAAAGAAGAALKPTRDALIESAHALYSRMISVEVVT